MAVYQTALVSDEELEELSGYSQRGRQADWLSRNGIGFVYSKGGRPRTTWGAVDHALTGGHGEPGGAYDPEWSDVEFE